MVANNGGMISHHQSPVLIRSDYPRNAVSNPFQPDAANHKLASNAQTPLWPPAFTLMFATCMSVLLWIGILYLVSGARHILGWL